MPSHLMDTAPGGESNPYESSYQSTKVFTEPKDKLTGQLGDAPTSGTGDAAGQKGAGPGPTGDSKQQTGALNKERKAEGYDEQNDMDRKIGA